MIPANILDLELCNNNQPFTVTAKLSVLTICRCPGYTFDQSKFITFGLRKAAFKIILH